MNEECIENKRSYNEVHALEFLNEDRTSKKKKKFITSYHNCKDQFWIEPYAGLGFGPTSPNNEFVEREKKNQPDSRKEVTIMDGLEEKSRVWDTKIVLRVTQEI